VILSEDAARWMLVLHTAVSVATVASLTHLVVWMWPYRKGDMRKHTAVRKFALISLALFATNFVVGNLIYPTYRTRVRAEYLDAPDQVVDDATRRAEAHARATERNGVTEPAPSDPRLERAAKRRAEDALRAARWFDVKEHWVAMGLALTAAVTLILFAWRPRDEPGSSVIAPYVLLLACAAAATVWIGAVIGVLTAAWRAI
jgi:heme A synthase